MPEDFTLATGATISGQIQKFATDGVSIETQRGVIKYNWSHFDAPTLARLQEAKKVEDAATKPANAIGKPAQITSITGTCTFGGQKSNWSAKLTARGGGDV